MMQTQIIIDSWNTTVQHTSDLLTKLGEEKMMKAVAPNRNRGIYLVGHLTAAHDAMLPLLGFREVMFPELKDSFLRNPDNLEPLPFTATDLIQKWTAVNDELKKHFNHLSTEDWLQKHNTVSEEDFAKEPHRNKLNVVLSRTIHLSYHQGQLALLK
ncbi:hypothetical protein [Flagellimonas marinaquae]|uniref:hypothetical protein n=1 Tax=Flagellimonas marinaquae TaxID=254955 RepID=UPI0019D083C8|nr:hypothetical protein [Allomuricauda aquimarina]